MATTHVVVTTDAAALLKLIERAVRASYELERQCRLAGSGGGKRTLSPSLVKLQGELHALVAGGRERGEGKVPLPEPRSRLAKTPAAGDLVDIDAHIKSYSSTPSKLRAKALRAVAIRAARAQEAEEGIEGDGGDDEALHRADAAGRLAAHLTTALSQIQTMSVVQLKSRYGKPTILSLLAAVWASPHSHHPLHRCHTRQPGQDDVAPQLYRCYLCSITPPTHGEDAACLLRPQ